jgi:hypothetical protein
MFQAINLIFIRENRKGQPTRSRVAKVLFVPAPRRDP